MKALISTIICCQMMSVPASFSGPVSVQETPAQRKSVLIIHSSSEVEIGYRISVASSGEATFVDGHGEGKGTVPQNLVAAFFADLDKGDISRLKVSRKCFKPVSIGTTISLRYEGKESPDIDCPGDAQSKALSNDVKKIAAALKVVNMQSGKGKELPPLKN